MLPLSKADREINGKAGKDSIDQKSVDHLKIWMWDQSTLDGEGFEIRNSQFSHVT